MWKGDSVFEYDHLDQLPNQLTGAVSQRKAMREVIKLRWVTSMTSQLRPYISAREHTRCSPDTSLPLKEKSYGTPRRPAARLRTQVTRRFLFRAAGHNVPDPEA
jgi:hypothetical protein